MVPPLGEAPTAEFYTGGTNQDEKNIVNADLMVTELTGQFCLGMFYLPETSVRYMLMYKEKIKLKETINLVGDPMVPESVWLPACSILGDRQLISSEPNLVTRGTLTFLTAVAAMHGVLGGLGAFIVSMFLASYMFITLTGIDLNYFMNQFRMPQAFGACGVVVGSIGFWHSLSFPRRRATRLLSLSLLAALVWLAWSTERVAIGTFLSITSILYFALSRFGSELLQAIPKSAKPRRTILSAGAASSVLGTVMFFILATFFTTIPHPNTPYLVPSSSEMITAAVLFCSLMVLQAMTVTLSSRSTSVIACAGLAALLQTPLIVGITIVGTLIGAIAFLSSIAPNYLNVILAALQYAPFYFANAHLATIASLSFVGVLLLLFGSILVGAWLGTSANKLLSRATTPPRSET